MSRVVVFDEFGGPDVMHVVEEPVVEPAAGEVRVRIEAFAVNPEGFQLAVRGPHDHNCRVSPFLIMDLVWMETAER